MEERLIEVTDASIDRILNEGLTINNLDHLQKLTKIRHMAKEDKEEMNYGNYGEYGARGRGRGSYGEYGNYGGGSYGEYGARGRGGRYRGDDSLDRMYGEYGRYQESRQRYGAGDQETDKSFHYMVKALEDFIMVLHEEADTPQQKQQLMQALQNSMR